MASFNNGSMLLGVPPLLPQQNRPCRSNAATPESILAMMTSAATSRGQNLQPRMSLIELIRELALFLESRSSTSATEINGSPAVSTPTPTIGGMTEGSFRRISAFSPCQMGMNRTDMERFQRLMTSIQLICKLVATERNYDTLHAALDDLMTRVIGNENVPLFNRVYVALLCGCIIEYGGHTTRIDNVTALLDAVISNFCIHKRHDEQTRTQESQDGELDYDSGDSDIDIHDATTSTSTSNNPDDGGGNEGKRLVRTASSRSRSNISKRRRTNSGNAIVVTNKGDGRSEETRKALLLVDRIVPAIATIVSSLGYDGFRRLSEAITLVEKIHEVRMCSTGTRWLYMLSNMLIDEEIIVLHPADCVGFRIRVMCISDNAALMVIITHLLWNRVPSYIKSRNAAAASSALLAPPPPPTNDLILSVFDGTGPQQLEGERFTNVWFFYNWTALNENREIDPMATQHWIWFEGAPVDIALFRGRRVILLGQMVYPRSFNVNRTFSMLKAQFSLVEQMSDEDTIRWLSDIATNAAPTSKARSEAENYLEYRHSFFKSEP